MNRVKRLHPAKQWIAANSGKHIVRRYAKWFGVDLLCAINELRLSGVEISTEYETAVKQSIEARRRQNAERKQKKEMMPNKQVYGIDYDDYHAYIIGFTSGGASFGITWEEAENMEESVNREDEGDEFNFMLQDSNEEDDDLDYNENNKKDETDDLPF